MRHLIEIVRYEIVRYEIIRVSDAAAAGLGIAGPSLGLAPGTVTGQTAIDGPGILFMTAVVAGASEGRGGPGLAFNTQIALQNQGSGQAFASSTGTMAFSRISPEFSTLSTRLGDLLSQTARLANGLFGQGNGYQALNQTTLGQPTLGQTPQLSSALAQQTQAQAQFMPSNLAVRSDAIPMMAWVWSGGDPSVQIGHDRTTLTLAPPIAPPTALLSGQAQTMPMSNTSGQMMPVTSVSIEQASVQTATVLTQTMAGQLGAGSGVNLGLGPSIAFNPGLSPQLSDVFLAAAWALPYGAGQWASALIGDEHHHGQTRSRRQDDGEHALSADEFEGHVVLNLDLQEGLWPVMNDQQVTIGVQDRDGRAVIAEIKADGRIVGIRLRQPVESIQGETYSCREGHFDLRMNKLSARRIDMIRPGDDPHLTRAARFPYQGMMPITGKSGELLAFADASLRSRRSGVSIAPTVLSHEMTGGQTRLSGFTMILAKQTPNGPECMWQSFDLEGRPLSAQFQDTAIE